MLVSDVISRVRKAAGDNDSIQFDDATVMSWINDATKECASLNQLLQKAANTTVTAGTSEYSLPVDILKLHSVKYDGQLLRLMSMQEFDELTGGGDASTGAPSLGYIWAGKLQVYPAADNSEKILKISYSRTPAEVSAPTDPIDLPVMYHRRIVDYCLAMVAEQDDDLNKYAAKMNEFRTGIQELKDVPEWEESGYPYMSVSSRDMGEGYGLD